MTYSQTFSPDFSKPTCRVCLQNNQDEKMASVFDLDADFSDLHIYEEIEQCAGIEVLLHEKTPTLICGDCHGLLKISFKFRTICQNSNAFLKELICNQEPNMKIKKSSAENPLSLTKTKIKEEKKCCRYKTRLKGRSKLLSQTRKNGKGILSNSLLSKDSNEFLDEGNDKVWHNIDYNDDEDDISYGENIEISAQENESDTVKKPVIIDKTEKVSKSINNKKNSSAHSKTLDISSDGSAIIRDKKIRCKREKKEKQPHVCDVCGNIYNRRYALEAHMKRHGDEKPFECEICGYAFYSNFELTRHMRKHTGSRPYKCSYCSRAFGDQSTLIKHERIHRNERPFKCETCGKSFSYSNVLKYHILTHTGEKPYSCEICGKCFNSPHHLRAHLRTLQHQSDPRTAELLRNIRKNNEGETLHVNTFAFKI